MDKDPTSPQMWGCMSPATLRLRWPHGGNVFTARCYAL